MLIYIFLPVAALVSGVIITGIFSRFANREKAGKLIYCVFTGVWLFGVAAFRYAVGHDYILYANWFYDLRFKSDIEIMYWSREKGFALPAKFLADISSDSWIMFAAIALVITAGVMLLIYKRSAVPHVSVNAFLISGLFFISLNFMRQFIAAVFIAFALRYIAKKRFCRFAGLVLLASAFHYSALLLLPFYFIFKIKLTNLSLSLMSMGTVVTFVFVTPLMNLARNFFYSAYDPVTNVEAAGGLSPVYTIVFTLFFVLAFVLKEMIAMRNKHANTLLMALFFTVFFGLLGTQHAILSRLALLFAVAPTLILSADIYTILRDLIRLTFKNSKAAARFTAVFVSLVFMSLGGFYFYYLLSVNFNGVVPYQTITEVKK